MRLSANPEQLSPKELLGLVNQLIAQVEALLSEKAKLKSEIEKLKRDNARSAATFSKTK
jgi:hypothetical protein